jgi:hypothetical protein
MYQPVAATGFRLSLQKFWPIVILGLNLPTHWCLRYGNLAMLTHYHSRQSYQNFLCYHFVLYHLVQATELTKPFGDFLYKCLLYRFYMSVPTASVTTRKHTQSTHQADMTTYSLHELKYVFPLTRTDSINTDYKQYISKCTKEEDNNICEKTQII